MFIQIDEFGGDLQTCRAAELDLLGLNSLAKRIRMCGSRMGLRVVRCGHRLCPLCSDRLREDRARAIAAAIRRMISPVHTVFGVAVRNGDVRRAITSFREALSRLRRHASFSRVRAGAGAIEIERKPGGLWLHAHVVLDIHEEDLEDDEDAIASAFRALTRGAGRFTVDSRPVERDAELRLARYITKPETWCPTPGSLRLDLLDALYLGLYRRQLSICWGASTRRRRATDTPTPKEQ